MPPDPKRFHLPASLAVLTGPRLTLPEAPALVAGAGRAVLFDSDGVFHLLAPAEVAEHLKHVPPLLVHAPATFRRLGIAGRPAYDLLELFAFVCPALPVAPTVRGLALALGMAVPAGLEAAAVALPQLASQLLARLAGRRNLPINAVAGPLAALMGRAGWGWAPFVLGALDQQAVAATAEGLKVWKRLPEWKDAPPLPNPSSHPVAPAEARAQLARLLGEAAEARPGQSDYAAAVSRAFAPREAQDTPRLVLAEAGTGIGKTLGYIAPASLWAERNQAPVWISTYTRHLQRQVEAELCRLYPERAERRRRAVVRKGRENYLCLLNYEEAALAAAGRKTAALIPLGLIARWAEATADGDLSGGDLPGWIGELFGPAILPQLADRRGECIYATCPHWRRCFIEHNIRRARTAQLVVANHALVMTQAAWGGFDEIGVPLRIVFDEGHRLFDAADAAFAAELSGTTMADLRRWLCGPEGGRARGRGLAWRVEDLLGETGELRAALDEALAAARVLPAPGWRGRLSGTGTAAAIVPPAAAEALLAAIATQVVARTDDDGDAPETDLWPVSEELAEAGRVLMDELARISRPVAALAKGFAKRLATEAETLGEPLRLRLEAMARVLARRALAPLSAWREMLGLLLAPPLGPLPGPPSGPRVPAERICFLRLDRRGGVIRDAALLSHWLDPTIPFAATLLKPSHGLVVTSATLRDGGRADAETAWRAAEARTGAAHLAVPALRVSVRSPFDYGVQTRAFVVTDLEPGKVRSLAAALLSLFLAAGGGALGLFTAIRRLRAVYPLLASRLEEAGIPLYAQHVDPMDNATLVEIFRTEEESCLLGTDAMRDGVDVPGRALRLVALEKVPWARPDILHRERRRYLGGGDAQAYDERMARSSLRQAFGRLIRAASDRGCFVLLDRRMPSRLLTAFPEGVPVRRAGLAEVVTEVRRFLNGAG